VIRPSVPRPQETKGQLQDHAPDQDHQIQAACSADLGQSPVRGKLLDGVFGRFQPGPGSLAVHLDGIDLLTSQEKPIEFAVETLIKGDCGIVPGADSKTARRE
jgi:hypothetical protein